MIMHGGFRRTATRSIRAQIRKYVCATVGAASDQSIIHNFDHLCAHLYICQAYYFEGSFGEGLEKPSLEEIVYLHSVYACDLHTNPITFENMSAILGTIVH
jgi:hypothetical protein